jgi:AraC-like DNA-binding protein
MATHIVQFDMGAHAPARRRDALEGFLSQIGAEFEMTPLHADTWSVRSRASVRPGGYISSSRIGAVRIARSSRASHDRIFFAAMSQPFRIERRGSRDQWGSAGDILFGTFGEDEAAMVGRTYESLAFSVEREALSPLVRNLEGGVRVVSAQAPVARIIIDYRRVLDQHLLGTPQSAPADGLEALAANHLRDLTALLLGARADAQEVLKVGGVRAARLAAIRDHMARHFQESDLNAEAVGKALGISPRYVRRLLEESGETFAAHLTSLRMDAAFRSLTSPLEAGRTISEIAYAVGYAEFSTFFRHFRQRWGMSPSEARAERSV